MKNNTIALFDAITANDTSRVKKMLKGSFLRKPVNINDGNEDGDTPLIMATVMGQTTIVKLLLDEGAEVNLRNLGNSTALIAAATKGHEVIAEILLDNGADIEHIDHQGLTPLLSAVRFNNILVAKLLLDRGANREKKFQEFTPLLGAISNGNYEITKLLIASGCNLDVKSDSGITPLFLSVMKNNFKIVELLTVSGADVNKIYNNGTPLLFATNKNFHEISELLIKNGADLKAKDNKGNTPLFNAIYEGMIGTIFLLIEKGADINTQDAIGYTPLMLAAELGSFEIVEILVKNGADLNLTDDMGNSALMCAITKKQNEKIAHYLIEKGTLLEKNNHKGLTALHFAKLYEMNEIVDVITKKQKTDVKSFDKKAKVSQLTPEATSITSKPEFRVFIASTFADMQKERHDLHRKVFPFMRKLLEMRNIPFRNLELRWGIPEKIETNIEEVSDTIFTCLDGIGKSHYFIGILGERYGYVPDELTVKLIEKEQWLKDYPNRSVTELEIRHALLNNSKKINKACLYFRDEKYIKSLLLSGEDLKLYQDIPKGKSVGNHEDRLRKLKEELWEEHSGNCKDYGAPADFSEIAINDFVDFIDKRYPVSKKENYIENEAVQQLQYALRHADIFFLRAIDSGRLNRFVNNNEPPMVIIGEPGI